MDNYIDEWYDAALAQGQGFKSEEDRQAYIASLGDPEDHPMFATDPEKLAANPLTDAFRQLNEEDKSRYELVIMYKEEANVLVSKGTKQGWRDAVARYTHALTFVEPALAEVREQQAQAAADADAPVQASAANATTPAAAEGDVEEIKSASVVAFEEQQRLLIAKNQEEAAHLAGQEAKIKLARTAKGHEAGSRPLKVDIGKKKETNINPSLSFDGDKMDSTPEELAAKKAEAVAGMEDHNGEKVLTFEEICRRSEEKERKIKTQSAGVTPQIVEQTRSQILGNRAMAQLSLKNFGSCIKDCDVALYFWPSNYKAYYRKCKSLVGLHRYELCLEAFEACQKQYLADGGPDGADAKDTKAFAEVAKQKEAAQEQLRRQKKTRLRAVVAVEKKKQVVVDIYRACTGPQHRMVLGVPTGVSPAGTGADGLKGLRTISANTGSYLGEDDEDDGKPRRTTADDVKYLQQLENTMPFWDPEEPTALRIPAVFLYPQHNQLDIIQACEPENMLVDYLAQMFPEIEAGNVGSVAPWDPANEYVVSKLVCYVHLNGGAGGAVKSEREWLSYHDADTVLTPEEVANAAGATKYKADKFCQLHLGCTVAQVISVDGHVLPGGLLHVLVFVNKSASHKKFLKTSRRHRSEMYLLNPTGQMTLQL